MDKQMEDIFCKLMDAELDKISKMPSLNDAALNNLHKLTDTKKNLLKIEKLEMELDGMEQGNSFYNSYRGNSNRRYYSMDGSGYARNNSYSRGNSNGYMPPMMDDNYYPGNNYSNGYSQDGDSYMHLEEAMKHARTEQERDAIRQVMSKLYR